MDSTSSDFYKSGLQSSSNLDPLPINDYKLSDEIILEYFPNISEEELDRIKDDLITISKILYNNNNEE